MFVGGRPMEVATVVSTATTTEQPLVPDASLVSAWLTDLRLHRGRTEATVSTYETHLTSFSAWLSVEHPGICLSEVGRLHVKAFLLDRAARGLAPVTRATGLYAIRSFYAYLAEEEVIGEDADPTMKVTVPGAGAARTLVYSDEEADAICDWARAQPGARWGVGAVILLTFRFTGLRLHELCSLRLDDLDLGAKRLSVVGKGSKLRTVPIPPVLSPALGTYLDDLRPGLADSPFVFVNPRSLASRQHHGCFADCAVEDLVRQAGEGAGVSERHFPHRWRHTYATSLLRRGVDIYKVKRLLGHSKLVTTERYLHLNDDDLADAVDKAFPERS